MEQVFNNPVLQKQFEQKGYVLLSQFLEAERLNQLLSLFEKHKERFFDSFHTSHFSSDVAYKQDTHDVIAEVVFAKAQPYLNNFMPLFGNFMIKNPNPEQAMDLHADWTYVDETKYTSVAIWIPLVDVNEENGCLGIIEGSHKVTNNIRGPLIRQSARERDPIWEKKYGTLLGMKAGDAIIYNHKLLHYSHPNKSSKVRPAINLSLVPQKASCIHYCIPDGTEEIRVYRVPDTSFYIHYTHFQTPQINTLIETLPKNTVKYIDPMMEKFGWIRWSNRIKHLLGF